MCVTFPIHMQQGYPHSKNRPSEFWRRGEVEYLTLLSEILTSTIWLFCLRPIFYIMSIIHFLLLFNGHALIVGALECYWSTSWRLGTMPELLCMSICYFVAQTHPPRIVMKTNIFVVYSLHVTTFVTNPVRVTNQLIQYHLNYSLYTSYTSLQLVVAFLKLLENTITAFVFWTFNKFWYIVESIVIGV